jgi:hypothetical protein
MKVLHGTSTPPDSPVPLPTEYVTQYCDYHWAVSSEKCAAFPYSPAG